MELEAREIRNCVLTELARQGSRFVPIGVSARHIHLSQHDVEALFGNGYKLQPFKLLSQPGQFAAQEQLTIVGSKGTLEKVRILGPVRNHTQVELAMSDAMRIGVKAPIRMSGDLAGTPSCILRGPAGEINLPDGVIVASRHLHMSDNQANAFGLKNGDSISIRMTGARSCILGGIIVRCGAGHDLEVHLDTDEANAGVIESGALVEIVAATEISCETNCSSSRCECNGNCHNEGKHEQKTTETVLTEESRPLELVTERDINDAVRNNVIELFCEKKALITPAAVDRAAETSIKITRV